ncbi:hypothetical protein AVEN_58297-1 [Araneus ventricosus]|uniref:ribonuclease H n=1 Tax=Araneus ventricosus TaxID=182803 RepID=A0A4Y2CT37_ARAVE|nr:hypothetical protein AVEN_58297-1 [Araneus ventricosus]
MIVTHRSDNGGFSEIGRPLNPGSSTALYDKPDLFTTSDDGSARVNVFKALAKRARKRLNILKDIAGRDWDADATTLRTSFQALIRPILEYGFPTYCCASKSNLKKLEKVQLSAAHIITGLKRGCPLVIVVYEADLQPLHVKRQASVAKYYNKLSSIDKRLTSTATSLLHLTKKIVCLIPKQLALEIINNIPVNDIKIYTDGSKTDKEADTGIYIETPRNKYSIKQRNPDFCSVFRSELLAIDVGLETIMSESNFGDFWILTDSSNSIQHLKNWTYIGDRTILSILQKLKLISLQNDVHFQWIPSHVDIKGNELADNLAKKDLSHSIPSSSEITFLELFSRIKAQNKAEWLVPPSPHWYKGRKPGFPFPFHATGSPVPVFHDLPAAT